MKLPQTGGCQCGKIRYEISETPQSVYACHCRDCQRLTSSAFSMGIVVPEAAFKLGGVEGRETSDGFARNAARGSPARRGMG